MHENKIGSRGWHKDVQKDVIVRIKSMEHLYQNIDSLSESWVLRISTALMANKAVSSEKAINPQSLPKRYEDNIDDLILKGYAIAVNGRVYLTTRGKLIANSGMRMLVENDMWPPTTE